MDDEFWKESGFVSAGNVEKLEEFFEHIDHAVPITYTNGGRAKLKFFARNYVNALVPKVTDRYKFDLWQSVRQFKH